MELLVHSSGREDPEIIEIEATALVRELILEEDAGHGVWIREIDEEIDLEITIEEAGIKHNHHIHRGRCRRVDATVAYNGDDKSKDFGPARTIRTVRDWACTEAFPMSKEQAELHVLALPEADHYLKLDTLIGSLATPGHCAVTLELWPRSRFEG